MVEIGTSGLHVLPIALGANTFGWTATREVSFEILDAFVAGGGSLVDTADAYSVWAPGNKGGESETIIGEWLASRGAREDIVVSTKVSEHPDQPGLSAANVASAASASLRRLQTDYIDIYFAHVDHPETPLAETVEAFAELVDRGLVRNVGLSNYSADRVGEWLALADAMGADPPVVLQPEYNLVARGPFESGLQAVAQENGLGVMPYFGLAAGFLTGKYRTPADAEGVARQSMFASYLTEGGFAVVAAVREIAEQRGAEPAAVALAWLRLQPTIVAPIGGATTLAQVRSLLESASLALGHDELARLEEVSNAFHAA